MSTNITGSNDEQRALRRREGVMPTPLSNLRPLVDCDSMIYRCGFAVKEDEPESHSIHLINKSLENILAEFDPNSQPLLALSGKTNFRDYVATIQPYKGNRVGSPKPPHYSQMREHLAKNHGAIICEGREADDVLGEAQWLAPEGTTCIVTQDKDLKTIKGWHFNWVTKKAFDVSPVDADLFLLWQVIQGDRTDHIPGLNGFGEAKATKIIKEAKKDVQRAKRMIVPLYQNQFKDRWREALHEITTLLFIHREPGKTYIDYIGSW